MIREGQFLSILWKRWKAYGFDSNWACRNLLKSGCYIYTFFWWQSLTNKPTSNPYFENLFKNKNIALPKVDLLTSLLIPFNMKSLIMCGFLAESYLILELLTKLLAVFLTTSKRQLPTFESVFVLIISHLQSKKTIQIIVSLIPITPQNAIIWHLDKSNDNNQLFKDISLILKHIQVAGQQFPLYW